MTQPEIDIRCQERDNSVERIERALQSCEEHLSAKIGKKTTLLKLSQILYFEVVDRITFAYTKAEVAKVQSKLNELTSDMFYGYFRISKSTVVNVIHIKNVTKMLNGNLDITMINGEHIIISRRYVPEFNRFIKNGGN